MSSFKYKLGINEIKTKKYRLYNALFAEFLGLFLLNFFGCGSCLFGDKVQISFTFGLIVFGVIVAVGHVSGSHINPAITLAVLAVGEISVVRGVLYVLAQMCGAFCGSAALKALLPNDMVNGAAHTNLHAAVKPLQGLGLEFFLGFVLILVVFGSVDPNKPGPKIMAGLNIGLTVAMGHLGLMKYTGASMNPARSFGTAAIYGIWENHWIYWIGPILGGIAAGLVYTQVFKAPEPEETINDRYRTNADEKEMRRLDGKA